MTVGGVGDVCVCVWGGWVWVWVWVRVCDSFGMSEGT